MAAGFSPVQGSDRGWACQGASYAPDFSLDTIRPVNWPIKTKSTNLVRRIEKAKPCCSLSTATAIDGQIR